MSKPFPADPAIGEETQSGKWDGYVDFNGALDNLAETDMDIHSILRELKEESEAKISEEQGRS